MEKTEIRVLCQADLLRSPASYILFPGGEMGPSQQDANQAILHKENTRYHRTSQTDHTATMGLKTSVFSKGKAKFPGTKTLTHSRPRSQLQTRPCQVCPLARTEN